MKRIISLVIFVAPLFCAGQTTMSFHTGMATFAMDDAKLLVQRQVAGMGVPAKITSLFPSYYTFGFGVDRVKGNLLAGMHLNFGSTGSRVYYSDYSGYQGSDQLISFKNLSSSVGYITGSSASKFRVSFSVSSGISIIEHTQHFYLNVTNYTNNYDGSNSFTAVNFFLQPDVSLRYSFKSLLLGASVGYNANVVYSGGSNATYKDDLSGVRTNLSLGLAVDRSTAEAEQAKPDVSLGLGLGLDYGGIGTNILVYPTKNIGVFTGVGYALAGVGVNGGLKIRFNSENKKRRVFATAMYGYNTAVVVSNTPRFNKLFYGPSFGLGMDRLDSYGKTKYSFQLIVPIRGDDQASYISSLKSYGYTFSNFLSPVLISIGRRINF